MAMDYDPRDRNPTTGQVLAAWAVCLGIIGLAAGSTAGRHDVTTAAAVDPIAAAASAELPALIGARIPRFALCCSDQPPRPVAMAHRLQGLMSLPIDRCG
jgi:hypothetical protein